MDFPVSSEDIRRQDVSGYGDKLRLFGEQLSQALKIMDRIRLPHTGEPIRCVVVTGMGGSAIGGDLLRTYLVDQVSRPILVNRDYALPGFVGPDTLVFVSSYSGNTEETLAACRQAASRRAQIVGIASGGQLAAMAAQEGFPLIPIPAGYPPRAALGYSFVALLESMVRLGLVAEQRPHLRQAEELLRQKALEYDDPAPAEDNLAKQVAMKIHGRLAVIYAWGHRHEAVAMRWRSQLAEVGKQLSSHHLLPEMNHNEIVGWQFPGELLKGAAAIFLRDEHEPIEIRRRMEITQELVAPWAGQIIEVRSSGGGPLARLFSLVCLGDWISFYLAALNRVDPTAIERIDELKRRLSERSAAIRPSAPGGIS
jgi:glucose/mannose-6-phosphate isomerase